MTKEKYSSERKARGNKHEIADILGVTTQTLWNRESGNTPITKEAEIALLQIPLKKGGC